MIEKAVKMPIGPFGGPLWDRLLRSTNLDFSKWPQVSCREQLAGTLLERLSHHAHILILNGESYRFKQSVSTKKKQ